MDFKKVPPHNIEIEQSILGAIILSPSNLNVTSKIIKPNMFYKEVHKIIYESLLDLYENKIPVDIMSLIEDLRNREVLDYVGGISYITSLPTIVPTASNIEYYLNILIDKSNRRDAIMLLNSLNDKIYNEKVESLKSDIESLKSVFKNNGKIESLYIDASEIKRNKNYKNFIPTGINMLDDFLGGGFRYTSLNVLTGIPGSGKSTIINQMIANAIKNNYKTFLYSGELPESDLMFWFDRTVANEKHIEKKKSIKDKTYYDISEYCWEQIAEWVKGKFKVYGSESKANKENILAVIEHLAVKEGYKFFVLDNLMTFDIGDYSKQYQSQKQLCLSLKELAKSYDLVIILVAHPRKEESKNSKQPAKPSMYDVSGASEIVGSADTILRTERRTWKDDKTGEQMDESKLLILKNRWNGVSNRFINLEFDDKRKRFYQSMDELNINYGYDENEKFEQVDAEDLPF